MTWIMMAALMWLAVGGLFAALARVRSDEFLERSTRLGMPIDPKNWAQTMRITVCGPLMLFMVFGARSLEKNKQAVFNVIHDGNVENDGEPFDDGSTLTDNARAVFRSIDIDMHKDDVDRLICIVFMAFSVKMAHQDAELLWRNISELSDSAVKWLSMKDVQNVDIERLIASYIHHKTGHELARTAINVKVKAP